MAYSSANLGVVGYCNGMTLWHYTTTDTAATVDSAQYFNSAVDMLRVGDMILVQASTGGTREDGICIVKSNDGTDVDVSDFMPFSTGPAGGKVYLTGKIVDVSTAGQIYIPTPVAGTVTKIWSALNGAIGTADATLTPKIGGTPITDGAITIATASSAAGDVDSSTPSAANTVTAGGSIEIETDGASSNTVSVEILIEITPTGDSD